MLGFAKAKRTSEWFLLLANRHLAFIAPRERHSRLQRATFAMAEQNEYDFPEQPHWRNEVSSRLRQHRARKRGEKTSDSMEFDFPAPATSPAGSRAESSIQPARRLPKIIRFPSVDPEPGLSSRMPFETAEGHAWQNLPIQTPDAPRILDGGESPAPVEVQVQAKAPEQMQLLPSFDDIQLDASEHRAAAAPESASHAAPLRLRAIAAGVDAGLVLFAAIIFGIILREAADGLPQAKLAPLFALAVVGMLWMLYQYVFLVHSSGTPGMFLSQLELVTFDGKRPGVLSRRCRALACALSAGSLGLGYCWAFIDEDQLGWHDRMTQTLLRESSQEVAEEWF